MPEIDTDGAIQLTANLLNNDSLWQDAHYYLGWQRLYSVFQYLVDEKYLTSSDYLPR